MTVALMLNRKAGITRTAKLADYVIAQFDAAGIEFIEIVGSSAADAIEKATAIAHQVEAVIAVGGDGSVHTAAQVAWHHNRPLGIIASGSGDDIARATGLPHGRSYQATQAAVDHFVAAWLAGDMSPVDVLEVVTGDGKRHASLAVVSCGFDSRVSIVSQSLLYLRGTFRYIAAMIKTLSNFTPIHYKLEIDGQPQEIHAMMVCVGNGSMFGGGMKVLPFASVVDGELDLCVVNRVSIPTLLRIFPRVFKGTHVEHPQVDTFRAKQVNVDASGEQIWADGEYLGPSPARITVQQHQIQVVGARV